VKSQIDHIGMVIILFFLIGRVRSQSPELSKDSLLNKNYNMLFGLVENNLEDNKDLAKKYSRIYFLKAEKEKDSINQALGYHLLSLASTEYETSIAYLDSLIYFTKNFNTRQYPASVYYMKAEKQFTNQKYKEALDNAITANDFLKKWGDHHLKFVTKYLIAAIRARIGEHKQAIKFYNESKKYFKTHNQDYFELTLFGLSESHMALKHLDSTAYYANLGLSTTRKNDSDNYKYFVYVFGEIAHHKGHYQEAVDSLTKSHALIYAVEDLPNLAQNEYWLGASKEMLGETDQAIGHYKRLDSIFEKINTVPPILRVGWEKLIEYYHKNEDVESELHYAKKLMKVDSVLNNDYKYLSRNISSKYDIPNLIEKKEQTILDYKKSQRKGVIVFLVLFLLLLFLGLGFYIYRKRERKKEENYRRIIDRLQNSHVEVVRKETKKLNFSQELEQKITGGLSAFQNREEYLRSNVTVGDVAKKIGTNRKYLSQYINHVKGVKFPDYVNSLRIEYALRRFQTNEGNFRVWRMNAIATELGFSSREYYTKAFLKHTNIKPNDYLEKLRNDLEKQRDS